MPLQNRVTPCGEIIAVPERGAWMGNRGGRFHTDDKKLTKRRWVSRRWICCVLQFKGRHREVMSLRRYTELFFLDEATALAAGHRPCRECRHVDFQRFRTAWLRGNANLNIPASASIDEIDRVLHVERVRPDGTKETYRARLGKLPDGVMVALDSLSNAAFLHAGGLLWRWTAGGYVESRRENPATSVAVLTPRSTVNAIAAGYIAEFHSSASAH